MRKAIKISLAEADRRALGAIVTDRNSLQKHVWRAQIVLLTGDGGGTMELIRLSGTSKTSVWRWQDRFLAEGVLVLLRDKTRRSRIAPLSADVQARVVAATQAAPVGETTHGPLSRWPNTSASASVRCNGYDARTDCSRFKLSKDPRFAHKGVDIVGLYVNPPGHAVVLSIKQKSQIQALDRTQPGPSWSRAGATRRLPSACCACS
jgi:hypothetical protein